MVGARSSPTPIPAFGVRFQLRRESKGLEYHGVGHSEGLGRRAGRLETWEGRRLGSTVISPRWYSMTPFLCSLPAALSSSQRRVHELQVRSQAFLRRLREGGQKDILLRAHCGPTDGAEEAGVCGLSVC